MYDHLEKLFLFCWGGGGRVKFDRKVSDKGREKSFLCESWKAPYLPCPTFSPPSSSSLLATLNHTDASVVPSYSWYTRGGGGVTLHILLNAYCLSKANNFARNWILVPYYRSQFIHLTKCHITLLFQFHPVLSIHIFCKNENCCSVFLKKFQIKFQYLIILI